MHCRLINLIKLNLIYKKKFIRLKLNKYELKLIKILIKVNVIKFIKKNEDKYDIFLSYFDEKPIFQNLINVSKPSKPIFISCKTLKYITNKYKIVIILSTNKGLLTNFEAIQNNIGGMVILKLWN